MEGREEGCVSACVDTDRREGEELKESIRSELVSVQRGWKDKDSWKNLRWIATTNPEGLKGGEQQEEESRVKKEGAPDLSQQASRDLQSGNGCRLQSQETQLIKALLLMEPR